MTKKILIDMNKLRSAMIENPDVAVPDAYFYPSVITNGLKTIRELAIFRFTCRRCEDAPCINVCPVEALEKDGDGVVVRYTNLCVSCKSCVTICPFGTMMTDFFKHHRDKELLYDLNDEKELEKFINACPGRAATITYEGESAEKNIYALNEKVLIKDYLYTSENQ
jgi:Fe-S-cluster-containing hydrogenase component 2